MQGKIDYPLLGRYLFGECSEDEHARVERWLAADPTHRQYLTELKRVLETEYPGYPSPDADAAWGRVRAAMPRDVPQTAKLAPGRGPARPKRAANRRHLRAAALFAGVALAVAVAIRVIAPTATPEAPSARFYETKPGQRATIQLLDGTAVHLNAGSRLTVAADFGDGQRAVALEGQAYFDVTEDPERPFLVETSASLVRVVGTAFDVRAYPGEAATRVVVAEGRVAVQPTRVTDAETALLQGNDLAIIAGGGLVVELGVDLNRYLAWKQGNLVFREAPFQDVVTELERWYGLEIDTDRVPGSVLPLNASFQSESLDTILRTTADLLDLAYRRDGHRVTFYR